MASTIKRVSFGSPELDKALGGGVPQGNLVLLTGGAGTGKTTFGMQFAVTGCKKKEKSFFVSTEQTAADLAKQAVQYGWDLTGFEKRGLLKIFYVDILTDERFFDKMSDAVKKFKPDRIIIDSLSTFSDYTAVAEFSKLLFLRGDTSESMSEKTIPAKISEKTLIKRMIASILKDLRLSNATILLTTEMPEKGETLSSDGASEFLSDGILVLNYLGVGFTQFMSLQIRKMRYTKHSREYLAYDFGTDGVKIIKEPV
ncbi:MAG: ATPase domain-containing protein [Candidatus Micrarchaeota archaeon]